MNDNALYFPYIEVPTNQWLVETLLYWDKLSSIVPYAYKNNPSEFSKRMQEYTSAELVNMILPIEYVSQIENFEANFLAYAEEWLKHNGSRSLKYTRIHIEKLGDLPRHLIELGVANYDRYQYPWIGVAEPLADKFMEYLATELGKIKELNATAVTNKLNNSISQKNSEFTTIRSIVLNNIMPIPDGTISIDSILRFKSDYGHLTKKFRQRIEEECLGVVSINQDNREQKIDFVTARLKEDIKDIQEAMQISWGSIIYSSIMPIIGGILTVDTSSMTSLIGTSLGTLPSSVHGIYSQVAQYQKAAVKPLAYATFVKDRLYRQFEA